ncbi:MAG TPA: adenylate/guanylate cyclase domain-containing protein, partial [Firmicutes bacterium]|nr:adenylate/guanylate cyclase domain-containing protein [Bacillota bacterium]
APPSGRWADSPVAVVAIDERTLSRYGQWPLPRRLYGELLVALERAGVRAVGFDLLFSEPDRHGAASDQAFAAALGSGPPVVLGFAGAAKVQRQPDGGPTLLPPWSAPLPAFRRTGSAVGHLLAITDPDGVLRRLPLWADTPDGPVPAFCLALARFAGSPPGTPPPAGGEGGEGDLLLDFRRGAVPVYSLAEVLTGAVPPGALRGRVVVVGVTASGVPDRYPTPLTVAGDTVPGAELQALAVATLLSPGLRLLPYGWFAASVAGTAILGALAGRTGRWAFPLALLGLLLVFAVGLVALAAGYWWKVTGPAVALAAAQVASLAWEAGAARRERRRLEEVFGRYLAPEVFAELLRRPDRPSLAGERVRLAVLFADLRGFTAFSAGCPPEEAVETLNAYLRIMVEAVQAQRGTVDKFLGDGIMAFFGAPLPSGNPSAAALEAARDLLARTTDLGQKLAADGRAALQVGIGLASGEALVGSVGTDTRSDYTAIGNPVNLASRLESLAQPGEILMDAATWAEAGGGENDGPDGASGSWRREMLEVRGWPGPVPVVRWSGDGRHSGATPPAVG